MITLYSWQTPNPKKIVLMLEELGLVYDEVQVDPGTEAVRAEPVISANPNGKIPAIVDTDTPDGTPQTVFESGAILIYLAEKAGSDLLPKDGPARASTFQWLMWQMSGIGPMIGQYFHFAMAAPEKLDYPIARYEGEMHRLLGVLEEQLKKHDYVAGPNYTIADIAIFPWVSVLPPMLNVDFTPFPSVAAWVARISERPAVKRTYQVAEPVEGAA